jgi:hypothetical protein
MSDLREGGHGREPERQPMLLERAAHVLHKPARLPFSQPCLSLGTLPGDLGLAVCLAHVENRLPDA